MLVSDGRDGSSSMGTTVGNLLVFLAKDLLVEVLFAFDAILEVESLDRVLIMVFLDDLLKFKLLVDSDFEFFI